MAVKEQIIGNDTFGMLHDDGDSTAYDVGSMLCHMNLKDGESCVFQRTKVTYFDIEDQENMVSNMFLVWKGTKPTNEDLNAAYIERMKKLGIDIDNVSFSID